MKVLRSLALVFVFLFAAQAAMAISIADARVLPAGTVVTVDGAVTVASGTFASSTFDQGFALEDDTAGIYVSTADSSNLRLNNRVRVTGVLGDDGFGLVVIRPASLADVVRLHGADHVSPEDVATGDVSEDTEGSLVSVTGTVTRDPRSDLPFGYSVFIDDGTGETQIFIPASTGVNPFNLPFIRLGNRITAIGFSGQFNTQYEVLPRRRADIRRAP